MNLPVKIFFYEKCVEELKKKYLIRSYSYFISLGIFYLRNYKDRSLIEKINSLIFKRKTNLDINCFSSVYFEKSIRLSNEEINNLTTLYQEICKTKTARKNQLVNFFVNLGISFLIEEDFRKL